MAIDYKDGLAPFAAGRVARMEHANIITRLNTSATAMGFGTLAVRDGADGVKPLAANGDAVVGIVVAESSPTNTADTYAQYANTPVMTEGVIGVTLAKSVTAGNQARVVIASGKWTDASKSASVAEVPGAIFETTGGGDGQVGLVRFRLGLPAAVDAT